MLVLSAVYFIMLSVSANFVHVPNGYPGNLPCPQRCLGEERLCVFKKCSNLSGVEAEKCASACEFEGKLCNLGCKQRREKCDQQMHRCLYECVGLTKDEDKCGRRCELQQDCCVNDMPQAALSNDCGNACNQDLERCGAQCLMEPLANRSACGRRCAGELAECVVKCSAAETRCATERRQCDSECPSSPLDFSRDCREVCTLREACCDTFPLAPK